MHPCSVDDDALPLGPALTVVARSGAVGTVGPDPVHFCDADNS